MFEHLPFRRTPWRRFVRPTLELLEDRCVPAPILVNSPADTAAPPAGTVTLRSAIIQAEGDPAADTIAFDPGLTGQTINLASPLLTLTKGETITGLGPANLTVRAATSNSFPFFRVFSTASAATVTISGLTITGGRVQSQDGGGILNSGLLTLSNDVVTGNTALNGDGGGTGGGIRNAFANVPMLILTLINSTVSNNSAQTGGGIGISGTVTVSGSTISGNNATNDGGGLVNNGGNVTILNSTVVNNTTSLGIGGGIRNNFGSLTVNDSTVTGNTDSSIRGGVGGIAAGNSSVTFNLNNTIVAGNSAGFVGDPDISGAANSGRGNFIGIAGANLTGIADGKNGNQVGTTAAPKDPQLGPLQNNGGPTLTRAPLAGSPVIDRGVNAAVPPGTNTDQRGSLRFVGPAVDVGAVEFQPAAAIALTATPGSIRFGQSTTLTATVTNTSPAPNNPITGSVTFFNGPTLIGTADLNAGGVATITFTPPSAGTFTLGAAYSGNASYPASTAPPVTLPVSPAATTTALAVAPNPTTFGKSVTLTATVASPLAGPNTPVTGTVTFFNGTTVIGTAPVNGNGVATLPFTPPAAGALPLGAAYSGNANFAASTAPPVTLQVNPQPTTTTLTVVPAQRFVGQAFTLTARVAGTPDTPRTGTVTFFDGTTAISSAPVDANGVATLSFTARTPGRQAFGATYGGVNDFAPSTAAPVSVTVRPPQTIGVFDPFGDTWYLKNSDSAGAPDFAPFKYGGFCWNGLTGNWTGSGQDTVAVVEPATETWFIKFSNTAGAPDIKPFQYGAPGWTPLVGDWTGSGKDTIAVVDPATETWYVKNSANAGAPDFKPFQFGAPGWIPVVGDWNGTGHTGIGVFDPMTATWYLRNEVSAGAPDAGQFQYGGEMWTPVVGNWSGNGKTTVAVFDPNATWYIKFSNTSGAPDIKPFQYGGEMWTPLAGNWQTPAAALRADATGSGTATLANATLQTVVTAALGRLSAAGVDAGLVQRLASARFEVDALPGDTLGLTFAGDNRVEVSATAAGRGWFTDASAASDAQYANGRARPGTAAATGIDLLTTVLHEMGHLAGHDDVASAQAGDGLMAELLGAGQRRVQALDQVFAAGI